MGGSVINKKFVKIFFVCLLIDQNVGEKFFFFFLFLFFWNILVFVFTFWLISKLTDDVQKKC